MTNANCRDQYHAQGFYIIPEPLVSEDDTAAAVFGMAAIRRGEYDADPPPAFFALNPLHAVKVRGWTLEETIDQACAAFGVTREDAAQVMKGGAVRGAHTLVKMEMPQLANKAILNLVSNPTIGEFAATLTGGKMIQVWWVQWLEKPYSPSEGTVGTANVGWHQDRQYWRSHWTEDSELFTAWIALSDVSGDAGPMEFIAGSNRWGLTEVGDFFSQDRDRQLAEIANRFGEDRQTVPAIMPRGGVSYHDNLTFHGSGGNRLLTPRLSVALHLRTEKSRPLDDARKGLTMFIDDPAVCPVIFDRR